MAGLRIELLGGFRAGNAVWPTRRSAELVQLLALAEKHRLNRDEVIDALWPTLDGRAGAANLRKAAHHARKALGDPGAVVLKGGQVALFPDGTVETDVEDFEAGGPYPGDLLPEELYETWTQAPRERLRGLHADRLRAAGQWEELAEFEPTDEAAHRALMRRELTAGRRPAAIRWYGHLRTALRRELGILPSRETVRLYDRCVAGLETDEPALVGRQLELARATVALREPGEILVVRGPPGIGKSALLGELEKAVIVQATSAGGPYAPLTRLVEHLMERNPGLLDTLGDHARSALAQIAALSGPSEPLGRAATRHEVIGAVRRLLDAAGTTLVVDDVHLADEATLDLLVHLGADGVNMGLAYRPEAASVELSEGIARLERSGRVTTIDLGPLDHDDIVMLVNGTSPTPRESDVVERIVSLADGNPFFAIELAHSPVAAVPALMRQARDAIISRLDLDKADAAMLGRVALAGDELDPGHLAPVTGLVEADALRLADTAIASGTLIVSGTRYRFRHELVRQALIERFTPQERLAIHREAAERLAVAGAPPAAIAARWLAARRPAEAVVPLLAAAREATAVGAYRDALTHLAPLLKHDPRHADALTLRAEVLDALGDPGAPAAYQAAREVVGEPAAAELTAKQALATIKLGDPQRALVLLAGNEPETGEARLAHALAKCGAAALGFGDPEDGAARASEARRLAMESGDHGSLAVASWAGAAAAHARGDLRDSIRSDLRETATLPRIATSVFDGQLCITQRLLYGARPYDDVIAFADALEAEAGRLDAARGRAFAVTIRGEAKLLAGRLEEADADLRAGARLHRDIAAATGEAFAIQRRAERALYEGDRDQANRLLDEALAIARESDVGFHLFDRIYGARIRAAADPEAALLQLKEAETAVRGPLETCPGCRITLAVPAAIAAARAGDGSRAERWGKASRYLADIVMRLPAWYAALDEIAGHRAHDPAAAQAHFSRAAHAFAAAGQPLDAARCTEEAAGLHP